MQNGMVKDKAKVLQYCSERISQCAVWVGNNMADEDDRYVPKEMHEIAVLLKLMAIVVDRGDVHFTMGEDLEQLPLTPSNIPF